MKKILALLFLMGCTPHILYSPNLVGDPTEKYYADVDTCKHEQFDKNGPDIAQGMAYTGFGLAGGLAYGRPAAYDQIDDCLRSKGYKISN